MPSICYTPRKFSAESSGLIDSANTIIAEYQALGFQLTLRQLYYQFVSRDMVANNVQSYKRLGSIINDARLAGLIDWNAIEDRGRNLHAAQTWESPEQILKAAAHGFRYDIWQRQPVRVEVWVEKDALAGVMERACQRWRVPFFPCKGYCSQSEMWAAAMRFASYSREHGQATVILHFGDHDPSGIDMTRDIEDRLSLFCSRHCRHVPQVKRLALNMSQVDRYGPPPNPAKLTDSRSASYTANYGDESWELDALDPLVIQALVEDEVEKLVSKRAWKEYLAEEESDRGALIQTSDRFAEVREFLAE